MTNPEMEKAIEFIIKQQAQFTEDIQQLREFQARLVETQQRAEERTNKLENVVLRLADVVSDLAQTQKETDRRLTETKVEMDRKWNETGERLNALIVMFERYMNGRDKRANGSGETPNT